MQTQTNNNLFRIPLFVAISSLSAFFVAIWFGLFGPPQGVGAHFCEQSDGWIKQPANTWSNFGFVLAGLTMAWQMSLGQFHHASNYFTRTQFTPIFFSSLTILLGPGSMAMHATLTRIGGALDLLSMYLICAFLSAYGIKRFFNIGNSAFTILFFFIIAVCEWAGMYKQPVPIFHHLGNVAFAIFIVLGITFEFLNTFVRKFLHQRKWGYYCLASFLAAFSIWNMCPNGSPLCDPHSIIQGHAIWHLLDALAVYFLFRFYVSEHADPIP